MALVNGKWNVVRGDCLWNIAISVYGSGKGHKWKDIANANGIKQSNPIIYPGQKLTLPGITSGSTGNSNEPKAPTYGKKCIIDFFVLRADTERDMIAVYSYSRKNFDHYLIRWKYCLRQAPNTWVALVDDESTENKISLSSGIPADAVKVRFSVKPISKTYTSGGKTKHYWTDGEWESRNYDFSENPPLLPPTPTIDIDSNNNLTVTMNNIDPNINADSIEIAIYQNDTIKYKTANAVINTEVNFAEYTCVVPDGYRYKVKCRAVRGTIYGGWTEFTNNELAVPTAPNNITVLRPQAITDQGNTNYCVLIEWPSVENATSYEVQWTTNVLYFDTSGNVSSQTTETDAAPSLLISDIELGHEYFFRVRSINSKGNSIGWTPIKQLDVGSRPSAPTTWSNTSSCILGEDLNLYWVHNSTDGSVESYARLNIEVTDSANPLAEPFTFTQVIQNTRPQEHINDTSVYTINSNNAYWSTLDSGFIIKWKVQTAGVGSEYSEWSTEREVNVYASPELELEITNQNGESIEEVNTFPFHISVLATPPSQTPISYYLKIVANEGYETVDEVGNIKIVNIGDIVYEKFYDPGTNAWRFIAIMSPSNIDLQNNISYTVSCIVAMNSGLTAISTKTFDVYFNDDTYDVYADVIVHPETLSASIHPYCNEYTIVDDVLTASLSENYTLAVYRREYDGTFTEIATGIENSENLYVSDPHPSLDYARYRVVATSNTTGSISYCDIPAVKVGDPSVVIQWAEEWSSFETEEDGEGLIEPAWSGSMLKIPYNVDISENKNIDVSLIEYAGRKHPVSYYGTQLGESSSWNVEIPAYDKELLYGIRRLSNWTGDVYVREPSGIGYWANISVSYNMQHLGLTIPVSFNITRVEGGI